MASSIVHAGQEAAVEVSASRADVAVFVRQGDDLLVALENGDVVTILDFYTPAADGASRSLAFTDGPETVIEVQAQDEEIVGMGLPMGEDGPFAVGAGFLGLGLLSGPVGDRDDASEDTAEPTATRDPIAATVPETRAAPTDATDQTTRKVSTEPADPSDTPAEAAVDRSTGSDERQDVFAGRTGAAGELTGADTLAATLTGHDPDLADGKLASPRSPVGQIVEEIALLLGDPTEGAPVGDVLGGASAFGELLVQDRPIGASLGSERPAGEQLGAEDVPSEAVFWGGLLANAEPRYEPVNALLGAESHFADLSLDAGAGPGEG